ncbi:MAG: N-acetyl sugar amidotransferase [Chitinophagales bacterium]|nr:N-acetyl sugar amidotransferase [Bacteroidota bacterium]MCB9256445.1 N-acetyl sugar amidotransferase [Chitinophagales bacterium]
MSVVVNGIASNLSMQVCTRCVQDSTVPGISFDSKGECNFCALHDKMCELFPNDERGEAYLQKTFEKIKKEGKNKKYDCIVGISGGRDSTYLIWKIVKDWGLRPLAVHFNDGFDNPVGGENMIKAVKKLGVELRTISSDWREAKDLKISFLKASTPDLNLGTDIGIASSLYGMAHKENIKYILIGQSFRTEGVKPLSWSYFDGDYLRSVQEEFGSVKLKAWTADNPNFNLGIKELLYYTAFKGIKTFTPFYYHNYVRKDAEEIITKELDWEYTGAHYFDDLYHSLIKYVHRVKFNIDLNMNSDSALVRSGQLDRQVALDRAHGIYKIESERIIDLCVKRLGITHEEFQGYLKLAPKTFRNYKTSYSYIRLAKWPIYLMSRLNLVPKVAYDKYFNCGK